MYKDREKEKEYHKNYYKNKKETLKQQQRIYYENNKEYLNQLHKKYYEKNKDKILTRQRKQREILGDEYKKYSNEKHLLYRKNNPEKSMFILLKSRAKKQNTPFNLEIEDIKIPSICPVLNIPIIKQAILGGKKGPKQCSPSIDRIDNTKGYVKGNIQIISNKANTMKGNATPEELLQFAYWIILTYGHLIDKEIS